jgi:OmpA-OmpF porin, OOP family
MMIKLVPLLRLAAAGTLCAMSAAAWGQVRSPDAERYYAPYQKEFWGYAGVGVGRSDYSIDCGPTVSPCDDKDIGAKIWAGGRLNRFLGLELGYTHLGEVDIGPSDTRAQGGFVHLLGGIPLGGSSSINAKVGTIYSHTKTSGFAGSDSGFGLSYGAAAIIGLTDRMDLRLDWDRHRMKFATGRSSSDLYTVGVQWKFR